MLWILNLYLNWILEVLFDKMLGLVLSLIRSFLVADQNKKKWIKCLSRFILWDAISSCHLAPPIENVSWCVPIYHHQLFEYRHNAPVCWIMLLSESFQKKNKKICCLRVILPLKTDTCILFHEESFFSCVLSFNHKVPQCFWYRISPYWQDKVLKG